eukprot:4528331-Prorocentrum_lima.AAC.1
MLVHKGERAERELHDYAPTAREEGCRFSPRRGKYARGKKQGSVPRPRRTKPTKVAELHTQKTQE